MGLKTLIKHIGQYLPDAKIFAEIAPVKYNKDAIYTLVSDDGEITTAKNLKTLAEKYNMNLTVACTTKNFERNKEFYQNCIGNNKKLRGGVGNN